LEGDIGQVGGEFVGLIEQGGRRIHTCDRIDARPAGERPGQHPRAASDLQDVRTGEERAPHRLLLGIGAARLENAGEAFSRCSVELADHRPQSGIGSRPLRAWRTFSTDFDYDRTERRERAARRRE
jgi:hypothetical protein